MATTLGWLIRAAARAFSLEPAAELVLFGEIGAQDLDRHGSPEPAIGGVPDLAHAAPSEEGPELVSLPDRVGRSRHAVIVPFGYGAYSRYHAMAPRRTPRAARSC